MPFPTTDKTMQTTSLLSRPPPDKKIEGGGSYFIISVNCPQNSCIQQMIEITNKTKLYAIAVQPAHTRYSRMTHYRSP